MSDRKAKPLILLLASEQTSPSVLYGLYDVLSTTGAAWADMIHGRAEAEALDVRIVSGRGVPFRCIGGVPVEPDAGIGGLERADAVIVCDMYTPVDRLPGRPEPELGWLRRMYGGGAVVASVCSGTLVLAEAGLLKGCEATSHWGYGPLFHRHFPSVRFRPDRTVCTADEEGRLITAGAVTAWQDLALHLIAVFCGRAAAVETAKVFLFDERRHGAAPLCAMSRVVAHSDDAIARAQRWIDDHVDAANPVQSMAEVTGLNERTFARRFRAATGFAPLDYVQSLRIEEAKARLETTDQAIDDIAMAIGYEDVTSFRRLFKRKAGLTPTGHRQKFRRIAPEPA